MLRFFQVEVGQHDRHYHTPTKHEERLCAQVPSRAGKTMLAEKENPVNLATGEEKVKGREQGLGILTRLRW